MNCSSPAPVVSGCFFGVEEGAAFGGIAELHDGHDVQGTVSFVIPGSGEAVALLFAGGGVQGCGAVPGGEPVSVAEAVDVADIGQ